MFIAIIIALFCELLMGIWLTWFLWTSNYKAGAIVIMVVILAMIIISYKVLI